VVGVSFLNYEILFWNLERDRLRLWTPQKVESNHIHTSTLGKSSPTFCKASDEHDIRIEGDYESLI